MRRTKMSNFFESKQDQKEKIKEEMYKYASYRNSLYPNIYQQRYDHSLNTHCSSTFNSTRNEKEHHFDNDHSQNNDTYSYENRRYNNETMNEVEPSCNNEIIYEPPKNRYSNQYQNRSYHNHGNNHSYHAPLSPADKERQKIAEENRRIVLQNPEIIDKKGVKTIGTDYLFSIPKDLNREGSIFIFDSSSIGAAIKSFNQFPGKKICLLNFANSIKPGGGYLNGRNAQEECLCRQTLLYPTLDGNYMYIANKENGCKPEASDIMIYSPNVFVIRDDDYKMIDPFPINIISSAAVDNRGRNVRNCDEIMYHRIKKIIMTAASENNEILILGAFGCGVFKNDPYITAQNFYKVLVEEGLKNNFDKIIFPIFNNQRLYQIFKSTFDKH